MTEQVYEEGDATVGISERDDSEVFTIRIKNISPDGRSFDVTEISRQTANDLLDALFEALNKE